MFRKLVEINLEDDVIADVEGLASGLRPPLRGNCADTKFFCLDCTVDVDMKLVFGLA